MLLAVFLVLWVAVALASVVAYGVRPTRSGDDGWPRWVWGTAAASAVLLTVVLPALAVVYSGGTRERYSLTGATLTPVQVEGRELFDSTCKRCHTLRDAGAASTIGPDLDALQPDFDTVVDAVINGRARGNGQMPAGLASGERARAVASYLEAVAGREAR